MTAAFLFVLDWIFLLGALGVVVDFFRTLLATPGIPFEPGAGWLRTALRFLFRNRVSRAAGVLARDGIVLCITVALIGRVFYGLPAGALFQRYSTAFPSLVSSLIGDLTISGSHSRVAAGTNTSTTETVVISLYRSGSRYYGTAVRGPATIAPNASGSSAATVVLSPTLAQNFSFPSTCTLEGATRCDIRPEPVPLPSNRTGNLIEQHVLVTNPVPQGVAVLDVYDPNRHRIVNDAIETAMSSASELGKVCRLLIPANLPPGEGIAGEGTDVHNGIRTVLCIIADLGGTFAEAMAGVQQEGTPAQQYISSVQDSYSSYSYYYRR